MGVITLLLITPILRKRDLLKMKQILRSSWLLVSIIALASIYLIPQTLSYTFPSDSSTQVAIRDLGVKEVDFQQLAKRHGVVSADIHIATLHTTPNSPFGPGNRRLISIETPKTIKDEAPSETFSTYSLRSNIIYQHSFEQGHALGPRYITGDNDSIQSFIRDLEDTWPEALIETTRPTPHYLVSTAISSQIGKLLPLSTAGLTILIILSTVSHRSSYRASPVAGVSQLRLGTNIFATHLTSFGAWILVPLLALRILITIDISESTLLSVHRMMFLLSGFSGTLLLLATFIGSLIGWVRTAHLTRQRSSNKSSKCALLILLYITTLAMMWTFCSSTTETLRTIALAQSESRQAIAQRSLPHGSVLSLRHVTEPTYAHSEAKVDEVFAHMNGQGLLAVISPSELFGGSEEEPQLLSRTLYLNNTAASHYGLPVTNEGQVTIYRSPYEGRTESEIRQDIHDKSLFESTYGATCEQCEVTVLSNTTHHSSVPSELPRASYFYSDTELTASDFTIAVIPDTFFSPGTYPIRDESRRSCLS